MTSTEPSRGETGRLSRPTLFGFADNLDVRLAAHEAGMEGAYYPAADAVLLPHERVALERARPGP